MNWFRRGPLTALNIGYVPQPRPMPVLRVVGHPAPSVGPARMISVFSAPEPVPVWHTLASDRAETGDVSVKFIGVQSDHARKVANAEVLLKRAEAILTAARRKSGGRIGDESHRARRFRMKHSMAGWIATQGAINGGV